MQTVFKMLFVLAFACVHQAVKNRRLTYNAYGNISIYIGDPIQLSLHATLDFVSRRNVL